MSNATVCVRSIVRVEPMLVEWSYMFDASTPAAAMVKARAWMRREMDLVEPERVKVQKAIPGLTYINIMPRVS